MSNDLISRKAVMDYLQEQQANVIIEKNKNNPVTYDAAKGMLASVDAFMNFIVQAPTAYDVDKVVEQLKDKIEITWSHDYFGGKKDAFNEAIEIVKGGGVDE